jgi:hypothetical protein
VNIVVTPEQAALLKELALLDPSTRSASGFVRQLVDELTPLLRVMVPAMRAASQELDTSREALRGPLRDFSDKLKQLDLLAGSSPDGRTARSGSEDGTPARRRRARNSQGQ